MSLFRRAAIKALSTSSPSTSFAIRTSRSFTSSLLPQQSLHSAHALRARQITFLRVSRRTYATEGDKDEKSALGSAYESVSNAAEQVKDTVSSGFDSITPSSSGGSERRSPIPEAQPNPNLYVGNLFFEVTEETLKKEFGKFGTVVSAKIIYDGRGLSKGFGYIEFDSTEGAISGREALDGQVLEGRRLSVQFALKKTGGSSRPTRTQNAEGYSNAPSKTLFIGNMSYDMSDKDLNDLFRDIKNVLDVRVAIDRRTGQPRGFAHADFIDIESAEIAANYLKSKEFYGRNLRIDFSASSATPR